MTNTIWRLELQSSGFFQFSCGREFRLTGDLKDFPGNLGRLLAQILPAVEEGYAAAQRKDKEEWIVRLRREADILELELGEK